MNYSIFSAKIFQYNFLSVRRTGGHNSNGYNNTGEHQCWETCAQS